ncbi:hypothetical protein CFK41_08845 [Brachybacterium ginsengisoli]|uniref:Uncharacterized protein n=1 Tax=Brachybacterium ginsengisoli TaxID=1331682 RepID=A0A291GXB6_9MICO|nr:hypothetical protein CFK41_08845 [Brachybacterium ginsengisoli]
MLASDHELRLMEREIRRIGVGAAGVMLTHTNGGLGEPCAHLTLESAGLAPEMVAVGAIGQFTGRHADLLSRSPMSAATGERRRSWHAPGPFQVG